jgi:hypothetical protein
MKSLVLAVLAAASVTAGQASDTTPRFPALMTTVPEPRADGDHPLAWCDVIDSERRCGDALGEAWCRKRGYRGGFVKWTTAEAGDPDRCSADEASCPQVTTITCQGVPIAD